MIRINVIVPPDIVERILTVLNQGRPKKVLGKIRLRIEGEEGE